MTTVAIALRRLALSFAVSCVSTLALAATTETLEFVEPAAGAAGKAPAAGSGGERSLAKAFDTSIPAEVEPNGTSATATPIAGTIAQVQGTVFPAADIDFYSFAATAGDRVYAGVQTLFDASGSGDSVLDVLNTDGSTVIETDLNDGTFNANSSQVAGAILPTTGTYFLRVRHNTATGTIRPYRLHFRLQGGTPTAEVEPNNTPATATPLPASGWVSGSITAVSPGESDFYSLNLNAGDTVFLALDMNPERDAAVWNGRLGFGLFGNPPANQILLANDANAGASATDPNSEGFYFTVLTGGTYFVYVDSVVAAGLGATATYQLNVNVRPFVAVGGTCTTYTSTDVPQVIPTGPGIVSSTITVPGNPRITDLDVSINLNHAFMQDLDVQLRSPAGNDNGLFSDVGAATAGGPQTLMDVRIDDEAGLPFAFGLSSSFAVQPELAYRLNWFDGENAGGTWTLDIRDDATTDGGTLNNWSITVCEAPPPPTCAAGFTTTTAFSTDFEAGAAGFTHAGAQDEWELGLPTFVPITTCNSGTSCWKTDLDSTYNPSANQDLLSPNINLAGLSPPVVVRWAQRYHNESASFDHISVDARQVGAPATAVRLFEFLDATMNNNVGNPTVTVSESSGWSLQEARVDALAGFNSELVFHHDSDTTVQLTGLAIDDVSVTACRPLQADLSITKTDGVTTAVPGGSVTYTITASNAGGDPITGGTVADTFPASLTCTWTCVGAGGGTCTAAGAGNINDTVNLPVGGSTTHTASCAISAAATGVLTNTATVASPVTDPVPGNNTATDTDTLTPQADLGVTKTDGVTTATPGGSVTYTVVASNPGPSDAAGATVADLFPAALTCTWTCVGAGGGTCTAAGAGNLNDTVNLPAGGSVTYTASCTVSAAASGTLNNTTTVAAPVGVTDPNPANNAATDVDTLVASADLAITKTDGVTSVNPGGTSVYTITASNAGPSNAFGSTIADTFPAALTGCTWTCAGAGGGTCTAAGAGNINDLANLPSGGSVTYTASCTVAPGTPNGATIANTAAVLTLPGVVDPVPGNNSATDTDTVAALADLSLTKTDGVASVVVGGTLTYTIVSANAGPQSATGATVTDTFPAALTCTWTCVGAGGGTCTASGSGNLNDSVNLPSGGSVTHTATCLVAVATPNGTVLANTASIAAPVTVADPAPGNNSATDNTSVTAGAGVSGTKAVAGALAPGGTITYTIVLGNAGPGPQADNPGDEFVDVLPTAITYVSSTASGGAATYDAPSRTLRWNGAIAIGGSVTLTITATINGSATGRVDNQGTINFDSDGNGTNDSVALTDDPSVAGASNPTGFNIASAIPALGPFGLVLLALGLLALAPLARRRLN